MDKVVHFEITTDDTARAKEFYRSAFDWELVDADMGGGQTYTTIMTVPVDEQSRVPREAGAINGGFTARSKDVPSPVITVQVDAIDESLKKIEAAGGTTVTPRTAIPGMGAFAYFKDSEGNIMGLWEIEM